MTSYFGTSSWNTSADNVVSVSIPILTGQVISSGTWYAIICSAFGSTATCSSQPWSNRHWKQHDLLFACIQVHSRESHHLSIVSFGKILVNISRILVNIPVHNRKSHHFWIFSIWLDSCKYRLCVILPLVLAAYDKTETAGYTGHIRPVTEHQCNRHHDYGSISTGGDVPESQLATDFDCFYSNHLDLNWSQLTFRIRL